MRRIIAGLDLETTGKEQEKGHRIIEIACVLHDLDTRARIGSFEQRINPQRGIDPDAQAVHGISFEDLVSCPVLEDVAPKISALLQRCDYVVAHNGVGFDMPFLFGELLRVGSPLPANVRVIDTMLQGRWATSDGAVPNLGTLCFASDVPYDKSLAHGATYDVEVMLQCFFKHFGSGFFTLPEQPYVYAPPCAKEK